VLFVANSLYGFIDSMKSASQLQASAANLQAGARLALVGLVVNIAFAIIKIVGGIFGHAYALTADGAQSALDVAGSIMIWGGLRFAARPPDATHPYGHGKAEPLTAIFVAFELSWRPSRSRCKACARCFCHILHRRHSPF